jgi:putative inorganic carbon (HCO3(-)) transporter
MFEYAEPRLAVSPAMVGAAVSEVPSAKRTTAVAPVSYSLMLLFIFLLYSQIPQLVPAFDVARPVYVIGGAAILALVIEKVSSRRGWVFVSPESYLLVGFVSAAGLSCFSALWMGYAVDNTLELLKMVALYFLIINSISSGRQLQRLIWLMVLGGLFPAIGTLRYYLQGNLLEGRARWIGIFANPNELAYSLVILVPLAACLASKARPWKAALLWMIVAVFIAATYVSFSRGGMLGLLAVVALMGLRSKRPSLRVLMLVLLCGSLIFMLQGWSRSAGFTKLDEDANFQSRLITIQGGLAMFADHPLSGVGLGCSPIAWPLYAPPGLHERWLIIHNTFVQALSETGIGGFLCFTLLLGVAIYDARRMAHSPHPAYQEGSHLAAGLEMSLWGFVVCALSGGFILTWFPYLLFALVSSLKNISAGDASPSFAP